MQNYPVLKRSPVSEGRACVPGTGIVADGPSVKNGDRLALQAGVTDGAGASHVKTRIENGTYTTRKAARSHSPSAVPSCSPKVPVSLGLFFIGCNWVF